MIHKLESFFSSVLLITMYFPPEPGGGSTAGLNRAIILKKLGFNVFVLCAVPNYPSGKIVDPKYHKGFFYVENIDDITLIRLRLISLKHEGYVKPFFLFSNFVLASIVFMPKILKITGKIDLVYSLAPIFFSSISGYLYSKRTNSFFIYDVPDLWPEELVVVKSLFSPIIFRVGKLFAKFSYSLPDLIVTISESSLRIIQTDYSPSTPICTLPIGVNSDRFTGFRKSECRKKLIRERIFPPELENKFIILYAGVLNPAQQVENLIDVAQRIKEESTISIVIIGAGEDRLKIEEAAKVLNNIVLLAYQPRSLMPEIISSADLTIVLLSMEPIFSIAFPTKFYEYIACNKPVIAICKGELSEVINFNKIGLAIDNEHIDDLVQYIKTIKDSSDLLSSTEENVKNVLYQYSLDNISLKLGSILRSEFKTK